MKKYRIKLVALLVCLVVSFTVFFSCGEHTDDINSVKFYCVSDTQEIVGIEGDSDIMSPVCIFPTQCSGESFCPTVSFEVKDGMEIALTSLRYKNVSSAPESSDANTKKGVVEKKQNGQWVFYSDIVYGGVSTMIPKKIPFQVESGQYTQPVCIPWYDPGEYRITYFFREFIEHEDGKFSTGEQLFQVSHTVEVPPTDGNVLDIIAVGVSTSELQDSVALAVTTTQLDEMPWLSCKDVDIQEWNGSGWSHNSSVSAHFTYPREYIRQNYVYPMLGVEHPERYATVPNIVCEGVDKEGSYRLTLHFCENEDGSGEQYELSLNVRFDG